MSTYSHLGSISLMRVTNVIKEGKKDGERQSIGASINIKTEHPFWEGGGECVGVWGQSESRSVLCQLPSVCQSTSQKLWGRRPHLQCRPALCWAPTLTHAAHFSKTPASTLHPPDLLILEAFSLDMSADVNNPWRMLQTPENICFLLVIHQHHLNGTKMQFVTLPHFI